MKRTHVPTRKPDEISDADEISNADDEGSSGLLDQIKSVGEEIDKKQEIKKREKLLLDLFIKAEYQRQMHRLAQDYYDRRDTWFHFYPLTLLTLASGVLAFLVTSEQFQQQKDVFALIVGSASVFSVALQSCAKRSNYAARVGLHKSVALGMKKISDNITFNQIDPEMDMKPPSLSGSAPTGGDSEDNHGQANGGEDGNGGEKEDVLEDVMHNSIADSYRMVYHQVLESCDSTVPFKITQAFSLLDSRLTIKMRHEKTNERLNNALIINSEKSYSAVRALAYDELYCVLSNSLGWPWFVLTPDTAVNRVEKRVCNSFLENDTFLTSDYEVEEEASALCFRLFCCCLDPKGCFWQCCDCSRKSRNEPPEGLFWRCFFRARGSPTTSSTRNEGSNRNVSNEEKSSLIAQGVY